MAKNVNGSNGSNATTNAASVTLTDIARGWKGYNGICANTLWKWSHAVMSFVDAKSGTLADVGEAMAKAVGRAKAYDKSYVSKIVKAARETPNAPATPAESAAFMDLAYGNALRTAKKTTSENNADDAIARVRAAVKTARNKGNTDDAIRAAVEAILCGADDDAAE